MEEKRTCGTCNYRRQYYVKMEWGAYRKASCGHCVHKKLRRRRCTQEQKACEYWEAKE